MRSKARPSVLLEKPRMEPNMGDVDTSLGESPPLVEDTPEDPPSRFTIRSKPVISYRMPYHLYAKAQDLVDRGAFGSITELITYAVTRFMEEEYRGVVSRKEMSMELRKIVDEEMGKFMNEMLEEHRKSNL